MIVVLLLFGSLLKIGINKFMNHVFLHMLSGFAVCCFGGSGGFLTKCSWELDLGCFLPTSHCDERQNSTRVLFVFSPCKWFR